MNKKFLKAALSCLTIIILLLSNIPVLAEENNRTAGEAESVINGIVDYKLKDSGASDIQQWINGELTKNAGVSSEWYVIALSQSGEYNFSSYEKALLKYLSENEVYSASSRQKYALALIAAGSTDKYVHETMNDSIGQQGVMSWIFGLHLFNNGCSSNGHTLSSVKEKLLSLQLDDGGWAVMGTSGDVDVTAMAIQALAPYYKSDSAVKETLDKAVSLLSERQLDSGDYSSYEVGNIESTTQVIVALSSLGIDCENDSRFIKNGNTLFDGIKNYMLSDGTFSHKQGEGYNETATVQVFCSMVSYLRMKDGKTPIYVLDAGNSEEPKVTEQTTEQSSYDDKYSSDNENNSNYKIWVTIVIIVVSSVVCVVLYFMKKRNKKNFIVIFAVAAVAVIFVWVTDFQTADSYYENTDDVKKDVIGTVTLTIRCDTIADSGDNEYIPENGIILETMEYEIEDGDTVYDVLVEATAKNKIHIETTGIADSIYVQGINYIYEFDFGDLSGWLYHVNGDEPSAGCGEYELSNGDVIEWLYSCEMGKDIE